MYYDLSSNTLLAITLGLKEQETSISFLPTKLLPRSKTYCKLNKQVSQKCLTKALRTMSHLCKSLAINRHRNSTFVKKHAFSCDKVSCLLESHFSYQSSGSSKLVKIHFGGRRLLTFWLFFSFFRLKRLHEQCKTKRIAC